MKHKLHYHSLFIFALAAFAFTGCASTQSPSIGHQEGAIESTQVVERSNYTERRVDANISSAIRQKFVADGLSSAADINIDTTRGKVTLKGKVQNQAEADRAVELGRSVNGVKSVQSGLSVK